NKQYLHKIRDDDFADETLRQLEEGIAKRGLPFDENIAHKILPLIKERISIWGDLQKIISDGELDYFFEEAKIDPAKLPEKKSSAAEAKRHLSKVAALISDISDFSADAIKVAVWDYASLEGRGP